MSKLLDIIRGRTVFIMSHGGSITELQSRIQEFKDMDICWVSLGLFTNMENHILSRIGKKLDIVMDLASVPESFRPNYEANVRFPRLYDYLARPDNNLWLTSFGMIRDCVNVYAPQMKEFKHKTQLVDDLFPKDEIPKWMDVPNSNTLLIASMLAGGASKIFIFGMDGYTGSSNTGVGVSTYFCPDEHKIERLAALGSTDDPGINRDTDSFAKRFPGILDNYRKLFGNQAPIYNVSPITLYTVPTKIGYNELQKLL